MNNAFDSQQSFIAHKLLMAKATIGDKLNLWNDIDIMNERNAIYPK